MWVKNHSHEFNTLAWHSKGTSSGPLLLPQHFLRNSMVRERERARDAKRKVLVLPRNCDNRSPAGKSSRSCHWEGWQPWSLFLNIPAGPLSPWPPHWMQVPTWKTEAGAPHCFLLRPAASLSVAVQSSAFVFQLLLYSLLLETWGIQGKKWKNINSKKT